MPCFEETMHSVEADLWFLVSPRQLLQRELVDAVVLYVLQDTLLLGENQNSHNKHNNQNSRSNHNSHIDRNSRSSRSSHKVAALLCERASERGAGRVKSHASEAEPKEGSIFWIPCVLGLRETVCSPRQLRQRERFPMASCQHPSRFRQAASRIESIKKWRGPQALAGSAEGQRQEITLAQVSQKLPERYQPRVRWYTTSCRQVLHTVALRFRQASTNY